MLKAALTAGAAALAAAAAIAGPAPAGPAPAGPAPAGPAPAGPAPAAATGYKMQPGLWETTIRLDTPNFPRLQGERVYRRCLVQGDIDANDITPELETRADLECTTHDFKRSGNTATYRLLCKGDAGETNGDGEIDFTSATSYDATIHTTGQVRGRNVKTTRTVHAERVGDCPPPPPAGTSGG